MCTNNFAASPNLIKMKITEILKSQSSYNKKNKTREDNSITLEVRKAIGKW